MRQIDSMTDEQIEVLQLKGMLPMNTPTKTKAQHTPGPWKAERVSHHYGCYGYEVQPPYRGAMTNRSAPVAFINSDDEQDRANARLIAAAPDLLKACQMMLALDGGDIAKDYREEFDNLKATIAKAEGRAK